MGTTHFTTAFFFNWRMVEYQFSSASLRRLKRKLQCMQVFHGSVWISLAQPDVLQVVVWWDCNFSNSKTALLGLLSQTIGQYQAGERWSVISHIYHAIGSSKKMLYLFTWFLNESARIGSSAANEMLLSRMKRRIKLVNQVALTHLWHSTRILESVRHGEKENSVYIA